MKTGLVSSLFFLLFAFRMQGQNLVINPDFEDYFQCPNNQGQLNYSVGWYSPTGNTPDYFNSCYSSSILGFDVPSNFLGYQSAHSGNAYAGIATLYNCSANCREYISSQLIDTLKAGRKYCVEFWVSLADSSLDGVASIGAYFSDTLINDQSTLERIPVQPQVQANSHVPIMDSANWTKISGSFIAHGGERYIVIGTFLLNSELVSDTLRPHPSNYSSYYYVDDVSVMEVASCSAGNGGTICLGDSLSLGIVPDTNAVYSWLPVEGLSNSSIANPIASPGTTTTYTLTQTECEVVSTSTVTVTVKPDCTTAPFIFFPTIIFGNDHLNIAGLESNSKLEVFDSRGRLIFRSTDYQNDFGTWETAQGIYIVRLTRPNGEVISQKLSVVK